MSKMNFPKDKGKSKFTKFLSSKGFYVALAVCLVGASGATWMAVDKTITGIENANSKILQDETRISSNPLLEEAEKKTYDIPKVDPYKVEPYSAPPSSSSTPSSSQEQSSKPSVQSEAPVMLPVLPTLSYGWPVKGDVINPFSNGELVKNMTLGDWRTHDGVDIAAEKGSDVYAAADGTVINIKTDPLWGTTVTLRHVDNNESVYCGLEATVPIKVGEAVMVSQIIGKVDGVPCEISDANHIHFAMRKNGAFLDPKSLIENITEQK